MNEMECIRLLLGQALAPYRVRLVRLSTGCDFDLRLTDEANRSVLRRTVKPSQLQDQRLLVDLVDGLQRDLLIVEGRLQPCVIAAQRHLQQGRAISAGV